MPPTFPPVQRIELNPPPLQLVICQLRFPLVLALAANQPPEAFQRQIQAKYPVVRRQQASKLDTVSPTEARVAVSAFWAFEDVDSQWTVSLGHDFITLETKNYRSFDEFIERF